jgi:prepilin-type N-terminal cleavage/methylation domain-containing protein
VSPRGSTQAGFSLIEVLLAMVLMLIVLGATLAVFNAMERGNRDNQNLNESQQQIRSATDALAKRLRNLASPAAGGAAVSDQPIERAEPQDLIFRSVNSAGPATTLNPQNLQRYRYCLSPARRLTVQRQTWSGAAPATPTDTACPGAGWTETLVAAQSVVNATRPVFHYQITPAPGTHSEQTSVLAGSFATIVALRSTLWVDPDLLHRPSETSLSTRVFLRNQNRPPLAVLEVTATGTKLTLNASASDDPEGNPLLYQFFDNGTALKDAAGVVIPPSNRAVAIYKPATGGHSLTVKVTDVGGLGATSAARTATCNATACTAT